MITDAPMPGPRVTDAADIARFEALQRKLVPLWHSIQQFSRDPQTIVVVPSLNVDSTIEGVKQQAYEERYLFLLLLLRQARARLIYVTSQTIHADVVDYYLGLLPGVIASHARKRLFLVTPLDGSPRTLTEKLLERLDAQALRVIERRGTRLLRQPLVQFPVGKQAFERRLPGRRSHFWE
jgi:hypothetical protein